MTVVHWETEIGLSELADEVSRALSQTLAAIVRPAVGPRARPTSIRLRAALVRAGGDGTAGARPDPPGQHRPRYLLAPGFGEGHTIGEFLWQIERPNTVAVRIRNRDAEPQRRPERDQHD